jgi:chromate transporter
VADADPRRSPPALRRLFLTFAKIGLFSFGGGSATLALIQQEVVRRGQWLNARDFGFALALSRMYPGVHLLAQAVVIGYWLRGLPGSFACLLGMMLPASVVTIIFTVFFVAVRENQVGAAVINGLLPATGGLTMAVAFGLGQAELSGQPRRVQSLSLALMVGSFAMMAFLGVSSALAVLLSGALGVLLYRVPGWADGSD